MTLLYRISVINRQICLVSTQQIITNSNSVSEFIATGLSGKVGTCLPTIDKVHSTNKSFMLFLKGKCPPMDPRPCPPIARPGGCTKDSQCTGQSKCCHDGCSRRCMQLFVPSKCSNRFKAFCEILCIKLLSENWE
jgi:hypothetical protein